MSQHIYITTNRSASTQLAAMLSIKSIASSGVFILIIPLPEASKSCLDCGLNPSMNMLSCIGSEKPWVGVFRNKPLNLSSVSLNDSSGNWWKDEMAALLFAVFDSRKYFFKNFYTTSSHDFRLLPLKEWSHLLASPAKENENRLNLIASAGTPASLIPGDSTTT